MMSFLTLRIWQAYAFEHPQFWQRIDAPVCGNPGNSAAALPGERMVMAACPAALRMLSRANIQCG